MSVLQHVGLSYRRFYLCLAIGKCSFGTLLYSPDSYIRGPCSDNALCTGKHSAHGHSAGSLKTYNQTEISVKHCNC